MKFATRNEEPIIALCTPQGSGALALLRISGQDSVDVVDKLSCLVSKKKLKNNLSHTIHFGNIVASDGSVVDEVLFFLMRAPNTFTGEDTVEITCHNNNFIIEQIISEAILNGARLALPGEFSRRAFLNSKIDLIQAEGINDVISSQSDHALKKSMGQMQGTFSNYIQKIEMDILKALTYSEAHFEFLEEEQRDLDLGQNLKNELDKLIFKIQKLKESFSLQKQIKEGIRISLIGLVNAGKSTLFNALLNQDRAIVTDIPGTTRDSIEASLYKGGGFWTLTDTAGLRKTDDFIEKVGIERSIKEADKADIVLLVIDSSKKLSDEEQSVYLDLVNKYMEKVIIVFNKIDILGKNNSMSLGSFGAIFVSASEKTGIKTLIEEIERKVQYIFQKCHSPFLLNKRQYGLLCNAEKILFSINDQLKISVDYELVSYSLKESLKILGEITGKTVSEKMLDDIFNTFCIGK
ncbi:tRNA uridine-5-carboxymethylaminomethyl(34) synthesis GTPase MnmE [Candidatus Babeliales bacterium]|nr:tRNA uridine-5-carboxymethylaminomethyl(34) synthesis GTPase MnmE [Candidatus Babeliales bacterium]